MGNTANAKTAVAVTLDELTAGWNDGRDIERNEGYGAVSAAASPASSSIITPARLRFM